MNIQLFAEASRGRAACESKRSLRTKVSLELTNNCVMDECALLMLPDEPLCRVFVLLGDRMSYLNFALVHSRFANVAVDDVLKKKAGVVFRMNSAWDELMKIVQRFKIDFTPEGSEDIDFSNWDVLKPGDHVVRGKPSLVASVVIRNDTDSACRHGPVFRISSRHRDTNRRRKGVCRALFQRHRQQGGRDL